MKLTLMLTVLAFCASIAQAQSSESEEAGPGLDVVCRYWGEMAYLTMVMRQAGASMSDMMARVPEEEIEPNTIYPRRLERATIIEAFGRSRMSSEFMREEAAINFRNEVVHGCYMLHS